MSGDRPDFITELKQRKVFRVAAAYVVVAWVALQFFDLVFDNINAPDWVMQLVMAVVAIGFPVALVLAWAFDVSRDGVRSAPGRSRAFTVLVAVISLVSLSYVAWSFLYGSDDSPETTARTDDSGITVIDSIAVLPFESFSGNREDEYFADGLADTLLHKLAQLSNLKVIARNSSFQFKGSNKDAREIGSLLAVTALLEGSVQRQGDQVRVIAQLIDTSDGSHIWSSTFDDSMQNIFELQDRIAQAIMQQLQISISERDRMLTLRNGTDSPEAYELLMRAIQGADLQDRQSFDAATSPRLRLIEQALALDPDYAQAWESRSGLFSSALFFSTNPEHARQYLAEAKSSADKAIEVAPEYAGGYARMGWALFRGRDIPAAEQNFIKALELDDRQIDAMQGLGLIKVNSDPQAALDLFGRVRELDPQESFVYRQLFFAFDALGRLDEGVETLEDGIRRFPDESVLKADLAGVYLYDMGRPVDAALLISQILEDEPQSRIGIANMIEVWIAAGDADRAAAWLELFLGRYPESVARYTDGATIILMGGDPVAARETVEAAEESPNFLFDRSTRVGGICLVLNDTDCLEEHAFKMKSWLDEFEAQGLPYGPSERYRMAAAALANAARPLADRDTATIQALLDDSEGWPITGGRGYRYAGYLRAMLFSLLGDDENAAAELGRTLEFGDDGYLYRDIFRMPPDINPVLSRLDGVPGYDRWLEDYSGRREGVRGTLIGKERDGDILAATDVAL